MKTVDLSRERLSLEDALPSPKLVGRLVELLFGMQTTILGNYHDHGIRISGVFRGSYGLADSDTFSPVLAYTKANGERQMSGFVGDDMATSVAQGRAQLASNEMDATDAVLLYDGRITIGKDKVDAIIIEVRSSPRIRKP